jgi:hypothetical protein
MRTAARPVSTGRPVPAWLEEWERMPAVARGLGVGGLLLAFGLLIGFYIVVAGAVHRAELTRQHARLDLDRQAACSAFTQAQARELCALTAAAPVATRDVAHAVYAPPNWAAERRQVASRLY